VVDEAVGQFTWLTLTAPAAREHHFRLALSQTQHEFHQGLRVKRAANQITLNGIASGVLQLCDLMWVLDAFRDSFHSQ
jgi:hypothetical protein